MTVCPSTPPKFGNLATLQCDDSCFVMEFYDANRVCRKCNSECYTCSGTPDYCTSCVDIRFLEGSNCTKICSPGLYGVYSIHKCLSDCEDSYFKHDVDRLCYLVCPTGFYGDVRTKKCVAECPDGMYRDPLTIRCEICDFDCLKCTGDSSNCIECQYPWLEGNFCTPPSCIKYTIFDINNSFPQIPTASTLTNSQYSP